jgi:DNA-binding transcriptional LysR family regulator
MDLLHALGTFARTVETGSFSAVARDRNSSHSSVTRVIGQLEDHTGSGCSTARHGISA